MAKAVGGQHEVRVCDAGLTSAFDLLGKRWNGVLLATLTQGPVGYAALKRSVAGISDSVLSERLSELTKAGVVRRSVDEGPPLAVSYEVTEAGRALIPTLESLTEWASTYLRDNGDEQRGH